MRIGPNGWRVPPSIEPGSELWAARVWQDDLRATGDPLFERGEKGDPHVMRVPNTPLLMIEEAVRSVRNALTRRDPQATLWESHASPIKRAFAQ